MQAGPHLSNCGTTLRHFLSFGVFLLLFHFFDLALGIDREYPRTAFLRAVTPQQQPRSRSSGCYFQPCIDERPTSQTQTVPSRLAHQL
jgi:hypothetical protein